MDEAAERRPAVEAAQTAHTVAEVHDAIAQGLQAAGPVIIEALVDPAEYEHLILRPHKLGPRTQKSPHA